MRGDELGDVFKGINGGRISAGVSHKQEEERTVITWWPLMLRDVA